MKIVQNFQKIHKIYCKYLNWRIQLSSKLFIKPFKTPNQSIIQRRMIIELVQTPSNIELEVSRCNTVLWTISKGNQHGGRWTRRGWYWGTMGESSYTRGSPEDNGNKWRRAEHEGGELVIYVQHGFGRRLIRAGRLWSWGVG